MITGEGNDGFDDNAWAVHLNQQETDTSLLFDIRVGANQAKNMISILCMSGPDFCPIDDVFIAIFYGTRFQTGKIGARPGFGIALAPVVLCSKHFWQIMVLLFFGAVAKNDWCQHA